MLYRIRRPKIAKVAVVALPANGRRLLLKAAGTDDPGMEIVAPILKADGTAWRIAYAVVAEPGTPEGGGISGPGGAVAKGADGEPITDVWDADEIREACHSFARAGAQMTAGHFTDASAGSFVENFIAPADMEIQGHPVKAGSWVLGLDPSAETRAAINAGTLTGFSVEGDAIREPVVHSAPADAGDDLLAGLALILMAKAAMDPDDDGDADAPMTKAQALAILKRQKTPNPPAKDEIADAMRCLAGKTTMAKAGAWNPLLHPKAPAGTSQGGQFTAGNGKSTADKQKEAAHDAKNPTHKTYAPVDRVQVLLDQAKAMKHSKARTALVEHLQRVLSHDKQHVARHQRHVKAHDVRVARHIRQRAARLKAAEAETRRIAASDAKTAKHDAAAVASSAKTVAAGKVKAASAAAKRMASTAAGQSKLSARLAKGIGSSTPEPLGPKDLWKTPGLKLPPGLEHLATRLRANGMSESEAIATAISALRQGCATGKFGAATLHPDTRATACKVVAQFEAARAKAKATA